MTGHRNGRGDPEKNARNPNRSRTEARYALTKQGIRRGLDAVDCKDPAVRRAIKRLGYPQPRRRPAGFETLLRIIVGQQLSTQAAATIYARLTDAMSAHDSPAALLRLRRPRLRKAGLSRQKIEYARALAKAVDGGELDFAAMACQTDEQVIEQLTSVKGLGVWSAHMYLMFSLGRIDVWPGGDLAVRAALQGIKGLEARPTEAQSAKLAQAWQPYRSCVALLCWKYVSNPPA